ncbi:MAG: Triosephosphate isomerase [Candidatus Levybacteria bacterium GW2011_GWA2_40_8]|nr:MAG: Triosephosphate isomerase [Candidatus Levybacteria bacterium GW2011_GWA2_40_8]
MQKTLIVANWKSHKTISEGLNFVTEFAQNFKENPNKEIVLCPSFTIIYPLKQAIEERNLQIKLGAQDISFLSDGPYTGEVNSKQIKEVADYVIIGHSERRKNLKEMDEVLFEKVRKAIEASLTPIFCVQNENTEIPSEDVVIAYEPPESISTSGPGVFVDDLENVKRITQVFKSKKPKSLFLYGGSVNSSNVSSFTKNDEINGVLVGGKSLSAQDFLQIYENA